jgi:DNA-binding transcriptional LysR family regulator
LGISDNFIVAMTTIDLNRVSTFVRVVEGGSFTAAAAALGVPTSSVSRSVARLEQDIGVRLLHRTTRKLSLTDGGQHYFQRMQAVIAEAVDASEAVAGFSEAPRGLVRLTAPADIPLAPILARLLGRHPHVQIELISTARQIDLVEEGVDLAIRAGNLGDSSLVVRKIGDTPLGLFASRAYLDRQGLPRAFRELSRHSCVLYRGRPGKRVWRLNGPRGDESVTVSGALAADDMGVVRAAVQEGLGVGLLPARAQAPNAQPGAQAGSGLDAMQAGLVRLLPKYAVRGGGVYLVWASRRLMPARVAVVRDFLADELARIL